MFMCHFGPSIVQHGKRWAVVLHGRCVGSFPTSVEAAGWADMLASILDFWDAAAIHPFGDHAASAYVHPILRRHLLHRSAGGVPE